MTTTQANFTDVTMLLPLKVPAPYTVSRLIHKGSEQVPRSLPSAYFETRSYNRWYASRITSEVSVP